MEPPKYEAPPPDPVLEQQAEQARLDKISALQQTLRGETSAVMQRYGTKVAMSGASIPSPTPSADTEIVGSPLFKAIATPLSRGLRV